MVHTKGRHRKAASSITFDVCNVKQAAAAKTIGSHEAKKSALQIKKECEILLERSKAMLDSLPSTTHAAANLIIISHGAAPDNPALPETGDFFYADDNAWIDIRGVQTAIWRWRRIWQRLDAGSPPPCLGIVRELLRVSNQISIRIMNTCTWKTDIGLLSSSSSLMRILNGYTTSDLAKQQLHVAHPSCRCNMARCYWRRNLVLNIKHVLNLDFKHVHIAQRDTAFFVPQRDDELANVTLLRQGLLGSSPVYPEVAFSLDLLGFYHQLHCRHPRLGIQLFVRTFCNVQDCQVQHVTPYHTAADRSVERSPPPIIPPNLTPIPFSLEEALELLDPPYQPAVLGLYDDPDELADVPFATEAEGERSAELPHADNSSL
ncbi:hypothetical protein NUW54_g13 [Trametes sanguinea]|uniref:Uncharacterized protein n=2 Tax=Trametes sanguinea TaxID=158606 RepID=A0ACC1QDZ0_9APHY|nr:hypothetical protein NUW54_g124 [Trametes sanguinea]KAJ3019698.1 hypothetical protein NUW54_g13 [Trametes sanguinea]